MKVDRQEMLRTAGSIGAVMILAGYIRYFRQEVMTTLNKSLIIGGVVLLLGALVLNFRVILAYFSRRSSRLGTNTGALVLSVLAILGLVNFLGYRHPKRFDLTSEKLYTLSDQTRQIVGGIDKDVRVIRFAKASDPALKDLMAEYSAMNHHIYYDQVDPQEKPEIAKQYAIDREGVIVTSGTRTEHLESTEEVDVTSAILKVTRDSVKTACFIEGHGEKSLTGGESDGYGAVDGELKKENYQTRTVNLVSANDVPPDCSVLVLAGPAKPLFPQEAAMIGKYLDGGGKALLLVDPNTDPKLDDVFHAWNIALGDNIVIDASGAGRMFGTGAAVPLVVDYGASPITRNFERTMTFFPLARTVSIADKSKTEVESVELLMTSAASFATRTVVGKEVRFDPAKDTRGPVSLGVAAEHKSGGKDARLVVIGNSEFAANQWVNLQRNGDLFFNTINWLAQDEDLISIRPKTTANRRINLTEAQQRGLWLFSLFFLPGMVFLSGFYIWWKRR
jgi:ABC-type uncharacterized transport system involved in gliding motility auxiliary subunit